MMTGKIRIAQEDFEMHMEQLDKAKKVQIFYLSCWHMGCWWWSPKKQERSISHYMM